MSVGSENLIAMTVLRKMVTPFQNMDAFKLGLIDRNGKVIKKAKTYQEKNALTKLDLLAINLKKLLAKVPGGSSMTGSIVGALYLIKEGASDDYDVLNHQLTEAVEAIGKGISFVEEEALLKSIMAEDEDIALALSEFAPVTSGGTGVALGGISGNNTGGIAGADSVLGASPRKSKVSRRKKKLTKEDFTGDMDDETFEAIADFLDGYEIREDVSTCIVELQGVKPNQGLLHLAKALDTHSYVSNLHKAVQKNAPDVSARVHNFTNDKNVSTISTDNKKAVHHILKHAGVSTKYNGEHGHTVSNSSHSFSVLHKKGVDGHLIVVQPQSHTK